VDCELKMNCVWGTFGIELGEESNFKVVVNLHREEVAIFDAK